VLINSASVVDVARILAIFDVFTKTNPGCLIYYVVFHLQSAELFLFNKGYRESGREYINRGVGVMRDKKLKTEGFKTVVQLFFLT